MWLSSGRKKPLGYFGWGIFKELGLSSGLALEHHQVQSKTEESYRREIFEDGSRKLRKTMGLHEKSTKIKEHNLRGFKLQFELKEDDLVEIQCF